MKGELIKIEHCSIWRGGKTLVRDLSWTMHSGEAWLVTGPNGGGKSPFLEALAGRGQFAPHDGGMFVSAFHTTTDGGKASGSVEMVSLEAAARLIQEEREQDESEWLDGGVDHGRTGRLFIAEALAGDVRDKAALRQAAARVETFPAVKLCGVQDILERGLKYMSTGEIRRTLLARALLTGAKLLILSDPFAGLDAASRTLLRSFFDRLVQKQLSADEGGAFPCVLLGMERYVEIPDAVTHVLEFRGGTASYCGERGGYEAVIKERAAKAAATAEADKAAFAAQVLEAHGSAAITRRGENNAVYTIKESDNSPIIEMNNVCVGWDGAAVLRDLTWTLYKGEHWLIRGPNGSGKTTFLELITGDNGQVYANDVRMFGKKRGTGETIWDIKARLGIVSYRLHVEYRMLAQTTLLDTVVSGLRDSIGLYGAATDVERSTAKKWLRLGGFAGREGELFGNISYGEQRSCLILRAAVKCPEVLILDEPCHGLSEEARFMVLNLLETVAESGTTTLLHVTHEASEVLPCEHHILELCPGEEPMYRIERR